MASAWNNSNSPGWAIKDMLRGLGRALNLDKCAGTSFHALAEQVDDFARGPAANVVVLVEDHPVEGVPKQLALADDVAVATVAAVE